MLFIILLVFPDGHSRQIQVPKTGKLNIYIAIDVSENMKDFGGDPRTVVKTLLRKVKNEKKKTKLKKKLVIIAGQLERFNVIIVVFTDFPLFHDPKL